MNKLSLTFLLFACSAFGATWYIDDAATGNGSGTNWANAWTNFYQVTNVVAGDTIEVSGGTYLVDTNLVLWQWQSPYGIAGSPVTIKHSREEGHNNQARITVPIQLMSFCNIDGAISDGVENVITNTPQVVGVGTNCGFFFDGFSNASLPSVVSPLTLVGFRGEGFTPPAPYEKLILYSNDIRWSAFCSLAGNYQTIKLIDTISAPDLIHCGGLHLSYCKISNVVQWAISLQMTNRSFGQFEVHHVDFCDNQALSTCGLLSLCSGGDVHHNLLNRGVFAVGGENESLNGGPGWRVYNNIFYACGAATFQCYLDSGSNYNDCYFYGNLICMQPTNRPIYTAGAIGQPVPAILSGGSNYIVGDLVRVDGGTRCSGFGTNEQKTFFTVKTVDGNGAITELDVFVGGWYVTSPVAPFTYIGGTGSGVSLDLNYVPTAPNGTYVQMSTEMTSKDACPPVVYVDNWRFFNNSAICTDGTTYGLGAGPSGVFGFLNKSWLRTNDCYNSNDCRIMVPSGGVAIYNNLTWTTNNSRGYGCSPEYSGFDGDTNTWCYYNGGCGFGKYNGWDYAPSAVVLDYNIGSGVTYVSNSITANISMSSFNSWTGYSSNRTTAPTLRNIGGMDFSPVSAAGGGMDLTAYVADMPGLLYDLNGVRRGSVNVDGSWSIGAMEPRADNTVTNGLILYYTFDDEWGSSNRIYDMSGFEHHAYQYGYPPGGPGSNCWPNRVVSTNNAAFGYAAEWDRTRDFQLAYDVYEGYVKRQYAAITNLNGLTNMSAMSVALWARYFAPNGPTMNYDANCTFIDTGYASNGCWIIGRDANNPSSYGTTFAIRNSEESLGGAEWTPGQPHLDFPDDENLYPSGVTAWHHYAAVVNFTNRTMNIYFDGTNCGSATITVTNVNYVTVAADQAPFWMALGVQSHNGTPLLEVPGSTPPYYRPDVSGDPYPNDAWFNGVMDEVRIYNRALTSNEVASIFSGGGSEPDVINFGLTVTKDGTGTGTVTSSPAGINCGGSCSASFEDGTVVTLTAAAAEGSTFSGWSGDGSGSGSTRNVTMSANRSVTATFTETPVTPPGTNTGSIRGSGLLRGNFRLQ